MSDRHKLALQYLTSGLHEEEPIYHRLMGLCRYTGDWPNHIKIDLTQEEAENLTIKDYVGVARFYGISLSTLFLGVDIKGKLKFV